MLTLTRGIIYGVIAGGAPPPNNEPLIFPSVAFPPPVILSTCANTGVIIAVAVRVNATDAIVAAATKYVASILLFMAEFIAGAKITNYIIVHILK